MENAMIKIRSLVDVYNRRNMVEIELMNYEEVAKISRLESNNAGRDKHDYEKPNMESSGQTS